ncbi:MAG: hypothetical protein JW395_3379 [Nitrospira sp.]|nr:hypothetical protein [Nitrospira sp.]
MPKVWPKKDPVIFNLDDIITFGKYRGASIKVICKHWPAYVNWVANTVEWVQFRPEVYDFLNPYLREANRFEAVRRTARRTYTPDYSYHGDYNDLRAL